MKILIVGKGYIAKRCAAAWPEEVIVPKEKIFSAGDARAMFEKYQPDVILNAAGVRGKPNVDWCEMHQLETVQGNVELPLFLAEAAAEKSLYLLHLGSGCIFYGPSPDPRGWKEDDYANPVAVYSKCKYAAELALATLPNIGIARIRLPIDSIPAPENLIDKLVSFSKVIDVENSVTIIEDMLSVLHQLLEKRSSGIFHVTNPGTITHREIIRLYEQYVDPAHHNDWITAEDLVAQGLAKKTRSNNFLQSFNLEKQGISMRPGHEALKDTMQKYAQNKKL
jgi:dTDP-4-dehydrorhamnose reductase